MKSGIHSNWLSNCVVTCGCGETFTTGSSKQSIQVDVCSACHPFYTGQLVLATKKGRIEKFLQKQANAQNTKKKGKQIKQEEKLTLKEMLSSAKSAKPEKTVTK